MDLLSTVKTLYDAIKSKQQIELVFGHYTMDANKYRQITFQSKNEENPYILNPYALFWNNGNCYLLATHKGHDNPAYFRVDRIVNVRLCQSPNPEDCMRAPIPEDLKQYFTVTADEDEIFNAELYTSMHPFLSIAQNENLVECFLECRQDALSLIVDTFGLTDVSERQIQVLKSNIVHEDELDQNGSPINYITVRIPNVQYESIKSFCINYHQFVTLLSPPLLVIEVFLAIIKSALRYSKVIPPLFTGKDDEVNPFISIGDTLLSALNKLQQ